MCIPLFFVGWYLPIGRGVSFGGTPHQFPEVQHGVLHVHVCLLFLNGWDGEQGGLLKLVW